MITTIARFSVGKVTIHVISFISFSQVCTLGGRLTVYSIIVPYELTYPHSTQALKNDPDKATLKQTVV